MADNGKKQTYPILPAKNWWDLRKRLQQSVPGQLGVDFLQSLLQLERGAAENVLRSLKRLGFVDESDKPTALANDWRLDEHYAEVCRKCRESVYPSSLLDAAPPPDPVPSVVKAWFMRNAGVGESAARQYSLLYRLLCEASLPDTEKPTSRAKTRSTTESAKPRLSKSTKQSVQSVVETNGVKTIDSAPSNDGLLPSVHIDVQIHLPADATPEQIDSIFASMAKHLKKV